MKGTSWALAVGVASATLTACSSPTPNHADTVTAATWDGLSADDQYGLCLYYRATPTVVVDNLVKVSADVGVTATSLTKLLDAKCAQ